MKWFQSLIQNKILIAAVTAWFLAQLIKVILELFKGQFKVERFYGSGGMPSAHSATVSSLAIACGLVDGFGSVSFAIAGALALIVFYDARGVRYQTGQIDKILNEYNARLKEEGKEPLCEKELPEKMGHTLPEIIAGIILGVVTANIVCYFL